MSPHTRPEGSTQTEAHANRNGALACIRVPLISYSRNPIKAPEMGAPQARTGRRRGHLPSMVVTPALRAAPNPSSLKTISRLTQGFPFASSPLSAGPSTGWVWKISSILWMGDIQAEGGEVTCLRSDSTSVVDLRPGLQTPAFFHRIEKPMRQLKTATQNRRTDSDRQKALLKSLVWGTCPHIPLI